MCLQFVDPDGVPYPGEDMMEQVQAMAKDAQDMSKKIVRKDYLDDGSELSTVWLGVCYSNDWFESPEDHVHIIYETVRFWTDTLHVVGRYATRAGALAGHMDALARYQAHLRG